MTQITRTLVVLFIFWAGIPSMQANEELLAAILAQHAQAAGADKSAKAKTLVETRLVQSESGELIQVFYAKKPGKFRIEHLTPRGRIAWAFNGTKFWCSVEKRGGVPQEFKLGPQEEKEWRTIAATDEAFSDRLIAAQTRQAQIETRENEPTADGQLLLFVTEKDMEQYRLKIDRQTGLLLAMYSTQNGKSVQYLYSNYTHFDDIAIPLEITVLTDGRETQRTRLSSIRYDVELEDALFSAPAKPKDVPPTPDGVPTLQAAASVSHASSEN